MYDIVGVDMPCMDLIVNIPVLPTPGGAARIQRLSWQGGGKIATGLAAAGRLGARCAIIGAVGDDRFGRFCVDDFKRHHVDTQALAVREKQTTNFTIVVSDQATDSRSFVYRPGTADWIAADEIDAGLLHGTPYFFVSSLNDTVESLAMTAKASGAKIVADADGYSDRMMAFAPNVDVFIASELFYQKLADSYNMRDEEQVCRRVMDSGPSIVVFTFGSRGCVGLSKDGFFRLPAFPVTVADTVGAGDVFHGAFIVGLLSGRSVVETARFASAASAIKCTRIGGRAGIPNRQTLETFLHSGAIDYAEIDERVAFYEAL